jgi:hypothetical protein
MKRIALMLVAVIAAFASNGIRPRGSAADYPTHVTSDGVTIAAAVLPPAQVRKIFAADLNSGGYIVIEVAVYPETAPEVDVSSGDFMLSPAGETSAAPVSARTIAGVLDRKNSPSRGRDTDVTANVGYETGTDPVTGRRVSGTYTGVAVANGPPGTLGAPPSGAIAPGGQDCPARCRLPVLPETVEEVQECRLRPYLLRREQQNPVVNSCAEVAQLSLPPRRVQMSRVFCTSSTAANRTSPSLRPNARPNAPPAAPEST